MSVSVCVPSKNILIPRAEFIRSAFIISTHLHVIIRSLLIRSPSNLDGIALRSEVEIVIMRQTHPHLYYVDSNYDLL